MKLSTITELPLFVPRNLDRWAASQPFGEGSPSHFLLFSSMVKVTVSRRLYMKELGRKTVPGEIVELDKDVADAYKESYPDAFTKAKETAQSDGGTTRKKASK